MRLQRAAEAALESTLRESGEAYNVSQGAIVSMDPDGSVRAMVGGRDYGVSTFNRAVNALRQPGSSFKPYVYATALENGTTRPTRMVRRRAGLDRQLVAAELRALLQGPADAAERAHAVAEHGGGAALDRDRPPADRRSGGADGRADADPRDALAGARHARSSPCSTRRPATPSSPMAATASSRAASSTCARRPATSSTTPPRRASRGSAC